MKTQLKKDVITWNGKEYPVFNFTKSTKLHVEPLRVEDLLNLPIRAPLPDCLNQADLDVIGYRFRGSTIRYNFTTTAKIEPGDALIISGKAFVVTGLKKIMFSTSTERELEAEYHSREPQDYRFLDQKVKDWFDGPRGADEDEEDIVPLRRLK